MAGMRCRASVGWRPAADGRSGRLRTTQWRRESASPESVRRHHRQSRHPLRSAPCERDRWDEPGLQLRRNPTIGRETAAAPRQGQRTRRTRCHSFDETCFCPTCCQQPALHVCVNSKQLQPRLCLSTCSISIRNGRPPWARLRPPRPPPAGRPNRPAHRRSFCARHEWIASGSNQQLQQPRHVRAAGLRLGPRLEGPRPGAAESSSP